MIERIICLKTTENKIYARKLLRRKTQGTGQPKTRELSILRSVVH